MVIEEKDFKLEYIEDYDRWDVYLLKVINAKDASKRREEMTLMAYGSTFESALKRIINYRLSRKEETISIKSYLNEYSKEVANLSKLIDLGDLCKK